MDQKKVMEYQFVVKQIGELQQHIQQVEKHVADLENLKETVSSLESAPEGTDLLVPLGSGVFFKSKKDSGDKVVISVGADVLLEKGYEDAHKTVDQQIVEMGEVLNQLQTNLNYLIAKEKDLQGSLGNACGCGDHGCKH